jgi:NADH-quinone oxidoreductase subunit F
MSKNLRGLSERKGLKTSLFAEISRISLNAQGDRDSLLRELSDEYLISRSSVLGTSSFYDFLKKEHTGKKVFLCDGTACLTSGKQEKLRKELLGRFSESEIGAVTCLGRCHTNHSFMYNHSTFSPVDLGSLDEIISSGCGTKTSVFAGTNAEKPALLCSINDLGEYYGVINKYKENLAGAIKEIKISALRGRGGAGFPFHLKLETTRNIVSDKKYVVCNADEGDPGAFSDKWLIEERPHSILFGMMITGLLTGADTGVIYIRGEYPESVTVMNIAIEQVEREILKRKIIFDKTFSFKFHVIVGAGAYICGEETSLLNSIEGLRPDVRTRPPFPAQTGLFGKPTVLSNVETFANIRYILMEGGAAFSALGTGMSSGTKLVSLDGAFKKPGIYEIRMGTPLNDVLNEIGGGTKYPVKAFQIGGPLGGIIPSRNITDLTLDFESFNNAGFLLGHAGVVSIPEEFPMIKYLLHLFEFTLRESCGKCFPCRIGSDRGTELIKNAIYSGLRIDKELFSDLLDTLQLGSLCALGGGLPLPVMNIMKHFSNELEEYFTVKKQ